MYIGTHAAAKFSYLAAVSALAKIKGEVGADYGFYIAAVWTMVVVDSVILVILCIVREQYPGTHGAMGKHLVPQFENHLGFCGLSGSDRGSSSSSFLLAGLSVTA